MMRNTLLTLPFLVLPFASCKWEAGQPVRATLYVRYEQPEQKMKAEAIFFKADDTDESESVVFQGGVTFMGSGMETKTLPGGIVRYEAELPAAPAESLPIGFKDELGSRKLLMLPCFPSMISW